MISIDRLKENTFLLVTGVSALVAWIIAFGGLCGFRLLSNVSYWFIVYELFLVFGTLFVFATSTFLQYRMALLTFLAISITILHGEINVALQATAGYRGSAAGAYAAGYIIMIIIQFLWVFVFGSEPNSYIGQFGHGWSAMNNSVEAHVPKRRSNLGSPAPTPMSMPMPMPMPMPSVTSHAAAAPPPQQYEMSDKTIVPPAHPAATTSSPSSIASPTSPSAYAIQVEALHDYTASPDDPSELSFSKGEILHVVERKGNWWQARKADGTIGIIPSNYFAP